jgi:hypothetical protein
MNKRGWLPHRRLGNAPYITDEVEGASVCSSLLDAKRSVGIELLRSSDASSSSISAASRLVGHSGGRCSPLFVV